MGKVELSGQSIGGLTRNRFNYAEQLRDCGSSPRPLSLQSISSWPPRRTALKFSVVTISFNQAQFLERAMLSVMRQKNADLEYIVVDPGSTDGSRDIIERHRTSLSHIIYEKDEGPADGLNKGFLKASGDVFCYLNSDDEFEPDAFARVETHLASHPHVDVVCGHAFIVDAAGRRLRRVWSDPFRKTYVAYGAAIQIQPSTFIRADAFRRVRGFNVQNRISWDSELLLDLVLSGARVEILNEFLSLYRLHPAGITGAGLYKDVAAIQFRLRFERLMGRSWRRRDEIVAKGMFVARQFRNPQAFLERLLRGKVYGRSTS